MIYLLLYAYCELQAGCFVKIHSSHVTMKSCQTSLEHQDSLWRKDPHNRNAVGCIQVHGFTIPPEIKLLTPADPL